MGDEEKLTLGEPDKLTPDMLNAVVSHWRRVGEEMPPFGVPVIAFIPSFGSGGHDRRIRATYAAPKTLPQADECEGGIYDEETDEFYCEEGWYEDNEYEEIHWKVSDPVTHWMPLPEPPCG